MAVRRPRNWIREVARAVEIVEKEAGGLVLRRGFQISRSEKFVVAEDVVTRGGRVQQTIDIVRQHGCIRPDGQHHDRIMEGCLRGRRLQYHQRHGQLPQLRHGDAIRTVALYLGVVDQQCARDAEGLFDDGPDCRLLVFGCIHYRS